jgi:hypothetical protein
LKAKEKEILVLNSPEVKRKKSRNFLKKTSCPTDFFPYLCTPKKSSL